LPRTRRTVSGCPPLPAGTALDRGRRIKRQQQHAAIANPSREAEKLTRIPTVVVASADDCDGVAARELPSHLYHDAICNTVGMDAVSPNEGDTAQPRSPSGQGDDIRCGARSALLPSRADGLLGVANGSEAVDYQAKPVQEERHQAEEDNGRHSEHAWPPRLHAFGDLLYLSKQLSTCAWTKREHTRRNRPFAHSITGGTAANSRQPSTLGVSGSGDPSWTVSSSARPKNNAPGAGGAPAVYCRRVSRP